MEKKIIKVSKDDGNINSKIDILAHVSFGLSKNIVLGNYIYGIYISR